MSLFFYFICPFHHFLISALLSTLPSSIHPHSFSIIHFITLIHKSIYAINQSIISTSVHPSIHILFSYMCTSSLIRSSTHSHALFFTFTCIYSIIRTRNRSICQLFSSIFNLTIKRSFTHSLLSGPVCLMA